jgi:hypothetical protein
LSPIKVSITASSKPDSRGSSPQKVVVDLTGLPTVFGQLEVDDEDILSSKKAALKAALGGEDSPWPQLPGLYEAASGFDTAGATAATWFQDFPGQPEYFDGGCWAPHYDEWLWAVGLSSSWAWTLSGGAMAFQQGMPGLSKASRRRSKRVAGPTKNEVGDGKGRPHALSVASDSTVASASLRSISGSFDDDADPLTPQALTTVMMRNLPNNYTRDMLLELLDHHDFLHGYDLVYLPIDFQTEAGLGYAFVNLVTPEEAERFRRHFHGFSDWRVTSEKVCEVSWSDALQGIEAHVERYRNSPVMHESVPDLFKPALFDKAGNRVPFPEPTKTIRPPRLRKFGPKGM